MLKSNEEIERIYFTKIEACAYINGNLKLTPLDYINHFHLRDWRKKGWVVYETNLKGKIHIDDVNKIQQFTLFHVLMAVKANKVNRVKQYLKENIKDKNSYLIKYIYEDTK